MRIERGLDLHQPESVSADEVSTFRASYEDSHGSVLDAYEFWLEFDPRVVKSHRIQAFYSASDEGRALPLHGTLGFLHLYTVMAYDFGIKYEVTHSHSLGASKAAILKMIELAFIHCGPRGIHSARSSSREILAGMDDADLDMSAAFPPGWSADPDFLQLGLDLTTPDLSAAEQSSITTWFMDVAGEVPAYVRFLSHGRPGLLKAYLDRLGRAMRGPLPKQMLPFAMLQMYVARANPAGIRESALLGRGLGVTADQIYEAAAWGSMYGGPAALTLAYDALADVFPLAD